MKKLLLILLILFTTKAFSQTVVSFGLTAGVNYSAVPGNGNPNNTLLYSYTNNYRVGFRVGGLLDIGFKSLSLQPGVLFTNIGGQSAGSNPASEVSLNYIQVPVNLLYKAQDPRGQFFIGGGPYISFGTSGTEFWDYRQNSDNLLFGNHYYPLHYPEIGLNALMGYRLNLGLAISAGFGYGLTDAYNYGSNNKNEVLNLSVSYFFTAKQLKNTVDGK